MSFNISQTNNAVLIQRCKQLQMEINSLRAQYEELETKAAHNEQTANSYAEQFTRNHVKSTAVDVDIGIEAKWETQTRMIKNITYSRVLTYTPTNEILSTTSRVIITLYDPLVCLAKIIYPDLEHYDVETRRISELFMNINSEGIEEDKPIKGITTINTTSYTPFDLTITDGSMFSKLISRKTNTDETTGNTIVNEEYSLGTVDIRNPAITFAAAADFTEQASCNFVPCNYIVKP